MEVGTHWQQFWVHQVVAEVVGKAITGLDLVACVLMEVVVMVGEMDK